MKPKPMPPPDLWLRLDEACQKIRNDSANWRKPGQFTLRDYIAKNGVGKDTGKRRLRNLVKGGYIKPAKVWAQNIHGVWQRTPGYELVGP